MNTLVTFTALLLVGLASTAPTTDDTLHIDDDFYPEIFEVYSGEGEITKIVVPLNSLNFNENEDETSDDVNIYVFFIEQDKGLFYLKNKNATKLLDSANDISAASDETKDVFFATNEGIYKFNAETNKAEKYGTLNDNIIGIAVANGTNDFYILTADHVLYKVTEDGNKKEEVTNVKDAEKIVLDLENNLYFVDNKKHVYVRQHEDGTVKSIKGLPAHPSSVDLLRPPFMLEDSIPVVAGKKGYLVHSNGTAEFADVILDTKPSAFAVETTLILYMGHNNKIYEYNVLLLALLDEELDNGMKDIKTFFADKTTDIQSIATKSRKSFRA